MRIAPPCSSASDFAMARPRPEPWCRLGELAFDLLERPPELAQRVLRDADAVVLDGDGDVVAAHAPAHRDLAAVGRELHRIGQEIEHDLLERAAIGREADRRARSRATRRGSFRSRVPRPRARHPRGAVEVDRLEIEADAAGLDLRHVENVVDDVEQIAAALADVAAIFECTCPRRAGRTCRFHDLGEADDGVERRAQLVAHIGEELRLGLVRFLGARLFLGVFLREVGELLGLALQRLLRFAQVVDRRHLPLLALDQLLLVQFELGDVGADGDVAAVLGAPFADMHPAPVVELRFEGPCTRRLAVLRWRAWCG